MLLSYLIAEEPRIFIIVLFTSDVQRATEHPANDSTSNPTHRHMTT